MSNYVLVVSSYGPAADFYIRGACRGANAETMMPNTEHSALQTFDKPAVSHSAQQEREWMEPLMRDIETRHANGDTITTLFTCPFHGIPLLDWMKAKGLPLPEDIQLVTSASDYTSIPGIQAWMDLPSVHLVEQGDHKSLMASAIAQTIASNGVAPV